MKSRNWMRLASAARPRPAETRNPLPGLAFDAKLRVSRSQHDVCLTPGTSQTGYRAGVCGASVSGWISHCCWLGWRRTFMKGRGLRVVLALVAACIFAASPAFAQGGGASTTGSINGKVVDTSGGVLPGVTVSASSTSLMGVQTSVTDASGNYRFPALPPGTYTVTFELPGFNTLKRENIQIAMGFTATVNVELAVASLQETVTVTGDWPVIDPYSTRVQQNFKLEQLQEIPNSRDLWSLLAVTPSVSMTRIDVGGNRAGTQTGYSAYGYGGQNRVLVEGINTTEGTSGAGFYVDYGSFEEVFLGRIGPCADKTPS